MIYPTKLAFKIVYGYSTASFIVTDSLDDVERAMYAKIEKVPVTIKGRFISGQEIKSIEPDVHSYTGWHRSYQPLTGDDFAQVERDVPKVLDTLMDATAERMRAKLASGEHDQIGRSNLTPELLLAGKSSHE